MAANMALHELPPLPSYTLTPTPSVIPGVEDKYLTLVLPIIAYWAYSMIFHVIDELDLFPQYRLHTPAEILKRNKASRWEVVRDVVLQQIIQTLFGLGLAYMEPVQMSGMEDYYVATWAQRVRLASRHIPGVFAMLGLDAKSLSSQYSTSHPYLAGALAGGKYPWLVETTTQGTMEAMFANWEILAAKGIYYLAVPLVQFTIAIFIVDTWQYFLHRLMHVNKYLYTTFHSRHHRLYVPYAYGALYNHPFEGFLLDTCGTGLAYLVTGMTPKQSMWFFTCSTIKTVDDHCGYALPWDPLQHLTSNNAGYHDVHHQSWGIKTNFSQPFFTFWDRILGTVWTGGDVSARYERARLAAARKAEADARPLITDDNNSITLDSANAIKQALASKEQVLTDPSPAGGVAPLEEEAAEEEKEREAQIAAAVAATSRRPPAKRKATNPEAQASNLKGLRERVSSSTGGRSFHGRTGSMLGYDAGR